MKIGKELAIRTITKEDVGAFGFVERQIEGRNELVPGLVLTNPKRMALGTLIMEREKTAVKGVSGRFIPVPDAFIDFEVTSALALAYKWDFGNILILNGVPLICANHGNKGTLVDLTTGTLVENVDWHGSLLCTKWRVVCPNAEDELTTLYSSS